MTTRGRAVLAGAIVLTTAAFLALTIARQWRQLAAFEWSIAPVQATLAVLALVLVLAWGVLVWRMFLGHLGVSIRFVPLLRIWFLSSLARYIPGKIFQFVGAAQLGRGVGIPAVPLLTSLLLHTGFGILSGALIALPGLLTTQGMAPGSIAALTVVLLAVAIALVHPAVLDFALRLIPRALHRDVLRWRGSWPKAIGLLFLFFVSWILNGLAFALFVDAITDVPIAAIPALIGANALAVVTGILVFVVPAGLGAREAALTLLLSQYLPAGVAAVIAVAARAWTLLAELLGAALLVGIKMPAPTTRSTVDQT